jgi:hypothetical protein
MGAAALMLYKASGGPIVATIVVKDPKFKYILSILDTDAYADQHRARDT